LPVQTGLPLPFDSGPDSFRSAAVPLPTASGGEAMGYLRMAQTLQRLNQPELSRQYMQVAQQKDPSLATMTALRDEEKGPSRPPIQRTSYQAPSVSPSPAESSASTESTGSLPRVIHLDTVDTKGASDNRQAPQAFVVPPPPTVTLRYPEPNETGETTP